MSSQAIIKIGPHGGKIVGFKDGKPIYLGSPEAAKFAHEAPAGSPAERAAHHDLGVAVHPTQHEHLQIAARGPGASVKIEAWAAASGGLPAGASVLKSSFGAHAIVPRAWAEKRAPAKPESSEVPAPVVPAAPVPPSKEIRPSELTTPPALAAAGIEGVDVAEDALGAVVPYNVKG